MYLRMYAFPSFAVEQSTGTIDVMRSELNDLKSLTSEGMSKMMRSRSRHEAREGQDTIAEMEKKLQRERQMQTT